MDNKNGNGVEIDTQDIVSFYQMQVTKLTMDKAVLLAQGISKDKKIKELTAQITEDKGDKSK